MHPSTHLSHFWERLHQLHPLCVDLNEGQQIPGLNRLKQLDHFSCRGRARLPCVLVVHIFSVDELLPHRPVFGRRGSQRGVDIKRIEFSGSSESTHMSLDGVGFGEGEERFPSMISLKLLFPMFLASWGGGRRKSQHLLSFHHSFIISNNSPEVKIVKGVHRCLRNTIYSLDGFSDSPRVLMFLVCRAPSTGYGRCGPPSLGGCQSTRCRSGSPDWWTAI